MTTSGGITAQDLIDRLGLMPHPEGGHYRETYRETGQDGGRGVCTAIHYLLRAGESSHWHRVDAVEIWLWHGGDPLALSMAAHQGAPVQTITLGDAGLGHAVQAVVPARCWQAARPLGAWSLVSCVVAPAFDFAGFEMAAPDWTP